MTGDSSSTHYPPPEPERIERALRAMRARRAKLRRLRIAAVSGAVVVAAAVAILAVGSSPTGTNRIHVAGSTTTGATSSTTSAAPTSTSAATTPSTARLGTQDVTYQPFTATGAIDPAMHVTSTVTGTCLTDEAGRSYRCFDSGAAAGVYDPCFAGPHGTAAPIVCPGNPATGDVVEFTATSVTGPPLATTSRPWAMQLAGGQVCVFVSAAWGGLGPYGCQFGKPSVTPADCRQPQSAVPWWTTSCQDDMTAASPFTSVRVTKVWF